MTHSKSILAGAVGLAMLALSSVAAAQEFPNKPIKILIPYPPGGVPDSIARAISAPVQAALGQPLVLDNRPGAGGMTAVQEFLRVPADGYTLLSGDAGLWGVLPALRPGTYDPEKNFTSVANISTNSMYITVRSDFPAKNIQEFIALVKSKPGQFQYASSGNGSLHHLFMESFKAATGLDMQHIPYKGSSQQVQALLAGDVPIGVGGGSATSPQVKAGKLRWLVATTRDRSKLTPDVPSMSEIGLSDLNFAGDVGYFAPAGTPRAAVNKIADAINKALQQPDVVQRVNTAFLEPLFRNPDQMAETVKADKERYAKAVKISGAKVD